MSPHLSALGVSLLLLLLPLSSALPSPLSPSVERLILQPPPALSFPPFTDPTKQPPLQNYQLHHPPVVPRGGKSCTVELLQYEFARSWDLPKVIDYTPVTDCGPPNEWAAIILGLEVTSSGVQFDRLGSISLEHIEVWRTSTAEPTLDGIVWTADKDVTRFRPVFARPGKLTFDENNLITDHYTGRFNTTLRITVYEPTDDSPSPATADVILPLSTGSEDKSQMMRFPGETRKKLKLPKNTAEAYIEILATGNGDEEFWYGNIPSHFAPYLPPSAELPARGPFREIQLWIDGQLATIINPFPILYTGGANPLLWRPMASLRAFDVPSGWGDLTAFLGGLTDDKEHAFELRVLGQGKGGSVNENWFLTASLHLILDSTDPPVRTTGRLTAYRFPPSPEELATTGLISKGNKTISTQVGSRRSWWVEGVLQTGAGEVRVRTEGRNWMSNSQFYADGGMYESISHLSTSSALSTHSGRRKLSDSTSYPLTLTTNYTSYPYQYSARLGPYGYHRSLLLPFGAEGSSGRRGAEKTQSMQHGEAEVQKWKNGTVEWARSGTTEEYSWEGRGEWWEEEAKGECRARRLRCRSDDG
ncbi:peptide N-acetyl-beta-D-glucosaminyl asparaginase amidase A-domain-containing protein [Leucosporidium creatinivorum]|uniref:Peptide N-acetyl-beta-D-glucosaminyl asparaginase amidase A-domain-containing protein n=1 Tax=Leucosporidium creatinivorum TaxID=106004 RepID=A0A1Y2FP65_9BASI|nr:peptide N-acetyl-beta-D-glucosaminyl asparaginase amidase A-domain-containing protein [Leucosporidium creatinivorum]